MSNFGKLFGELICRKREERGLSFAQLAIEAYGDDGKGGESRKSDVQKLELGQSKKPTMATIRKYRLALDLTQEEIDACRNPEEIKLAHFADELFAVIGDAAAQAGLSPDYVTAVAERYAEGNPGNFEGALNGMKAALEAEAKEKTRGTNLPVDEIFAEIERLNDAGEIDEADAALEADLLRRREMREQQNAEDSRILEKAIAQAITTRNADKLAERMLELIQRGTPSIEDQFHQLRAVGIERYEEGLVRGTPFALEAAVGLARKSIDLALTPLLTAMVQNDLGIALRNQGTRTEGASGTALLADAVTAYNAALTIYTKDEHPVAWAKTKNNLGITLRNQGTRTEGAAGTALLAEAVTAYNAALTVYTKDENPVDWAGTQNNLGITLRSQGTRTEGAAGTALLAGAVTAYNAALTVYTMDDHPVFWAKTQNNLGNALIEQSTRTEGEAGTALLAEAVTAYNAALTVCAKADQPVHWAGTQNNLGNALKNQGVRTEGAAGLALLADAVTAYNAALTVTTKNDHPVDWAMTQENLALTEKAIADHDATTDPRPHLEAALAHVEAALTVFDPEHMSYDHGTATRLRDRIKARLADLS